MTIMSKEKIELKPMFTKQVLDRPMWSPETAATQCGLEKTTILRAARRGEIPCYKISSRCVRFAADDVEAWILTHKLKVK